MKNFPHEDIQVAVESAMQDLKVNLKDLGSDLRDMVDDRLTGQVQVEDGDVVERSFEIGTPAAFDLKNISGRINITASDEGSTITVKATKRGNSRARANTTIEFGLEGNEVTVRTRAVEKLFGPVTVGKSMSAVDFEVTVPKRCAITVGAVSSDIIVTGVTADVQIKTVSGDVVLHEITGECSLNTVSGDITGHGLHGELMLRSTSGDGQFRASDLSSFNLHSTSGDFIFETPLARDGHYYARTVSGDLRLLVPANTGAVVSLKTISGDATVRGLPVEVIKSGRRNWQGRVGGGGTDVEMHSISGDLTLGVAGQDGQGEPTISASESSDCNLHSSQQSASRPAASDVGPPNDSVRQAQTADTTRILELLAHGEISVEEAMARIEGQG